MKTFIANNWVNMLLVIVGCFAVLIYILQERRKKIEAASMIILQIDELQDRLREISTYLVADGVNKTAFYESLPLMEESYWNKYKHYFVRKMDRKSYTVLDQFYTCASEIQEQQMLMKSLQKNTFFITQNVLANVESQLIASGLSDTYGKVTPQDCLSILNDCMPQGAAEESKTAVNKLIQQLTAQNPAFDANQFWSIYSQQRDRLRAIINQSALTEYTPLQIKISIEKILREYSMLEIVGNSGYKMLHEISQKRF
jgi:hypothetical protein